MAKLDVSDRYIAFHGKEDGYHITVEPEYGRDGSFNVTIWQRNQGMSGLGTIHSKDKAIALAAYLYNQLLPEYEVERAYQEQEYAKFEAEIAKRPKPKPPKIPKNAPIVDVLECSECNALIPPDEVSDEHVYECNTCSTTGTGDDGRQCEQCHKFTAKLSDTSCPECGAAMDEAETVQAQKATNGEWIQVASSQAK